jgi:hypothetical protein
MLSFFLHVVMNIKCFSFLFDMIVMNEIKENNYDVNILWKWHACLWVLEMTIAGNSDFS